VATVDAQLTQTAASGEEARRRPAALQVAVTTMEGWVGPRQCQAKVVPVVTTE
jgi:hypothetical protein